MSLFIVCKTKFTIGESRTISHANDTQAQQVAPNPRPERFSTATPLERERRLQIQREQQRRRRQQETAEQKEHRLAQRRQRRQQETEEQEIGIRGIMIVLHCRKPRFLSLPVSPPIYRSKSVSALYYGSKNNNFRANCTGPYLFFAFVFFLNPDAKIMLNLLFNTLLTIVSALKSTKQHYDLALISHRETQFETRTEFKTRFDDYDQRLR